MAGNNRAATGRAARPAYEGLDWHLAKLLELGGSSRAKTLLALACVWVLFACAHQGPSSRNKHRTKHRCDSVDGPAHRPRQRPPVSADAPGPARILVWLRLGLRARWAPATTPAGCEASTGCRLGVALPDARHPICCNFTYTHDCSSPIHILLARCARHDTSSA